MSENEDYYCDVADRAYDERAQEERIIDAFDAFGVDYWAWRSRFVDPSED